MTPEISAGTDKDQPRSETHGRGVQTLEKCAAFKRLAIVEMSGDPPPMYSPTRQ